jgi:hypothetical protein
MPFLKHLLLVFVALAIFSFLPGTAGAAVINVPANQPTIQAAIAAAAAGDTVVVAPGVYFENVQFGGKNITLRSTNPLDRAVVDSTIIDGSSSGSVVAFSGTEATSCSLRGLTIRNGAHSGIYGLNTVATVANCHVTSNSTQVQGGGILQVRTVEDCRITSNTAKMNGGGLAHCLNVLRCEILYNKVLNNSVGSTGGGLFNCSGNVRNNIIAGNAIYGFAPPNTYFAVGKGGAAADCNGAFQNNTIVDNLTGSDGSALYFLNGNIYNCIIWGNRDFSGETFDQLGSNVRTPEYSCIQFQAGSGIGCTTANPLFVNLAAYDFRLEFSSPLIDAGRAITGLTDDILGLTRPFDAVAVPRGDGSNMDMGAYELNTTPTAVKDWTLYQ